MKLEAPEGAGLIASSTAASGSNLQKSFRGDAESREFAGFEAVCGRGESGARRMLAKGRSSRSEFAVDKGAMS